MKDKFTYNFTTLHDVPYRLKCTRSGTAWGISDGVLKEFSANQVRLCRPFGVLVEKASTNFCLKSRALDDVVYDLTNLTVTQNQVGIDGLDDTAALIETTAENGLIAQDCTGISAADFVTFSCFIKIIDYTTTATILLTANGTDFSEVSVGEEGFTRVFVTAPRTSSSMTCGIKILEDNVRIAVDCLQFEVGEYPTSPIITDSVAVSRSADEVYIDYETTPNPTVDTFTDLWFNKDEGSFTIQYTGQSLNHYSIVIDTPAEDGDYLVLGIDRDATSTKLIGGINTEILYTFTTLDEEQQTNEFTAVYNYKDGVQLAALNSINPISQDAAATATFDFTDSTRMWLGNKYGASQIDGYLQTFTYMSKFMDLNETIPNLSVSEPNLSAPVLSPVSIIADELTITWDAVLNALGYRIEIATDNAFTELIDYADLGNVLTYSYTNTDNVSLAIRVCAYNGYQLSDYSNIFVMAADILTEDDNFIISESSEQIITE